MNRKITGLLFTCIILICAGVFVLAQMNQSNKNQDSNADSTQSSSENAKNSNCPGYKPKEGYVPDKETAIAIAVAVWKPIYGEEIINSKKPYRACLQ